MNHLEFKYDPTNGICDHDWEGTDWQQSCPKCGAERQFEHRCDPPATRPDNDKWTCDECGDGWQVIVSGWRWERACGHDWERDANGDKVCVECDDEPCDCRWPMARPGTDEWTCPQCGCTWIAETEPGMWNWRQY